MFLSAVCCFFLPVFLEQCANQRINNKFRKINEPHLCKQELLVWLFVSAGVYTSFRVDQSGFKPWAQLWIIPSPSISFQAACRCGCARELNWNQSPLLKVKSLASVSLHQIWLRACVRRSCFFGGSCSVLRGQTRSLICRIQGCSPAANSISPRDWKTTTGPTQESTETKDCKVCKVLTKSHKGNTEKCFFCKTGADWRHFCAKTVEINQCHNRS